LGAVNFYHLTRHGMDEVIDMLVPRALAQGWRVMIRSPDRAALERQDSRLWLEPEDGFLPHGLEGGPQDAEQPLLLGAGPAVNGAQAVLLLGPQPVDPAEVARLERLWLIFAEAEVPQARLQWKAVTTAGLAAQYWSDASGRWEMKAESAPKP
jgi:DNA polymerase-3 subunit chi